MALVTGKGTVLLKANSDVQPIVIEERLWHYVGHLLARTYRPTIQTVSGPNQYMKKKRDDSPTSPSIALRIRFTSYVYGTIYHIT